MRILHDNILKRMRVSDQERLSLVKSYPFENLYSPRLARSYKIDPGQNHWVGITLNFYQPEAVSCLLISNHTIDKFDMIIMDSDEGVEKTFSFDKDEVDKQTMLFYLPKRLSTSYIRFNFTKKQDLNDIKIGGLYIGRYIQMPPFDSRPKIGIRYTGKVSTSPDGLVFPRQGVQLKTFSCNFGGIKYESYDEIKVLKGIVQIDTPIWVDFYEERHDAFPPVYVRNTGRFDVEKSDAGLMFDKLKLKLEECK